MLFRSAGERIKAALKNPAKSAEPPRGMGAGMDAEGMSKMLASGKLPDGRDIPPEMAAAMKQMGMSPAGARRAPKPKPAPEQVAVRARQDLLDSTQRELDAMVNAFSGGYILPSPGGDPVLNPDTVPTGRNLYGIDPERTPTRESYAVGKQLADALIAEKLKTAGNYPKKVAFSL